MWQSVKETTKKEKRDCGSQVRNVVKRGNRSESVTNRVNQGKNTTTEGLYTSLRLDLEKRFEV